jgi:hypothetical protein
MKWFDEKIVRHYRTLFIQIIHMLTGDLIMFICGVTITTFLLYIFCDCCLVFLGLKKMDNDNDNEFEPDTETDTEAGGTNTTTETDTYNPICKYKTQNLNKI